MHERYSPISSIRSSRVGALMKNERALFADSIVAFSRLNVVMVWTPYRLRTASWAVIDLRIAWTALYRRRVCFPGMLWV